MTDLATVTDFRNRITDFEEAFVKHPQVLVGDAVDEVNPLKHAFVGGLYIREVAFPEGELLVTKIHKKNHPFFLMSGELSILTEDGVVRYKGPYQGITRPGTKRIIFTHTDCVFITVHATDKLTPEEAEEDVIAKTFDDPEISLEDMRRLLE